MDVNESVVRLIITVAQERCDALSWQLGRAAERQYPSDGPHVLIKTLQEINKSVRSRLKVLEEDPDIFKLLEARQIHQHVYRCSQLLPYLHEMLGLLDGAEIKDTPSAFVPSLDRLVREHTPYAELILASKTSLNYSFVEIAKHLKELLLIAGLGDSASNLPEHFVIITFPRVETRNVLLHSVLAHELGHGLYQKNEISTQLLPLVIIDKDEVERLANLIFQAELQAASKLQSASGQLPLYPTENDIRARITLIINTTVKKWLEELASDAIGLALFGPAYFFALVHFVLSFQLIDNSSESHPSNKLRIRLLLLMLGASGKNKASLNLYKDLPLDLKAFVGNWKSISKKFDSNPIFAVIIKAFIKILGSIGIMAKDLVGEKRYRSDAAKIRQLCELIVNGIPPNEIMISENRTFYYPGTIMILNAGWHVLIAEMEQFSKSFGKDYSTNKVSIKDRLNEIILKAVELDDIRIVCTK